MGIALAGASIGGAVMTAVVNWAISVRGWKFGDLVVATPMLLIAIPLLIAFVRTRPAAQAEAETSASDPAATPIELPGLEVSEAFQGRSMWLITLVQFLFASLFAASVNISSRI